MLSVFNRAFLTSLIWSSFFPPSLPFFPPSCFSFLWLRFWLYLLFILLGKETYPITSYSYSFWSFTFFTVHLERISLFFSSLLHVLHWWLVGVLLSLECPLNFPDFSTLLISQNRQMSQSFSSLLWHLCWYCLWTHPCFCAHRGWMTSVHAALYIWSFPFITFLDQNYCFLGAIFSGVQVTFNILITNKTLLFSISQCPYCTYFHNGWCQVPNLRSLTMDLRIDAPSVHFRACSVDENHFDRDISKINSSSLS